MDHEQRTKNYRQPSPDDALAILRRLAAQDAQLAAEIASLTLAYLSNVDYVLFNHNTHTRQVLNLGKNVVSIAPAVPPRFPPRHLDPAVPAAIRRYS